ncbi:MAG: hypothetical protein LBC63_02155 [Holophagales bacterium]|jgi:hypothetical protein|nr:hypothetical protein [Holophagales bacterium]
MLWRDATKIDEPAEDIALRGELQNLLGFAPTGLHQAAPTQESIALAQSLYREAMRRCRTSSVHRPFAKSPLFLLAAATIPLLFTAAMLGTWGVNQKRRADEANAALAAKTLELESRQNRLDISREGTKNREGAPILQASDSSSIGAAEPATDKAKPNNGNNGELVKPEEAPARLNSRPPQHRVNDPR